MRIKTAILCIICLFFYCFVANCYLVVRDNLYLLIPVIVTFILVNFYPGQILVNTNDKKLKRCYCGMILLVVFLVSVIASAIYGIVLIKNNVEVSLFVLSIAVTVITEAFIFWNGILRVYFSSRQLGVKLRVLGLICGMIPVINLAVLTLIIKKVFKEVHFEYFKETVNKKRQPLRVCETKYPLLLVHGVFFRDSEYFNYWGRIPAELEKNGAKIFYGNHHSASSVSDCGNELAERIRSIVEIENCEKINVIAHSKGGLDCRYALSELGIESMVASLTTINTPHRGCEFADYLLDKINEKVKDTIAATYNNTLKKLGDKEPDFLAAVNDLTSASCEEFNKVHSGLPEGVYCQSVGSLQNGMRGGKFPLNFSYLLVKLFDGKNDDLVSESSFKWGEKYTLLTTKENRGISHGDMIDLNRENIDGFDVREFYVDLVSELKKKGL